MKVNKTCSMQTFVPFKLSIMYVTQSYNKHVLPKTVTELGYL